MSRIVACYKSRIRYYSSSSKTVGKAEAATVVLCESQKGRGSSSSNGGRKVS